jgi:hypothetical protein
MAALGILPPPPSLPLDVDVVITSLPRESITLETPFDVHFSLSLIATVPETSSVRTLVFVIQHLLPASASASASTVADDAGIVSPRFLSSGFSTPSPTMTPTRGMFNFTVAEQKLLHAVPRRASTWDTNNKATSVVVLPSPVVGRKADSARVGAAFVGASAVELEPLKLKSQVREKPQEMGGDNAHVKVQAKQSFTLTYIPLRKGFVSTGGLRILLVEDQIQADIPDAAKSESGDELTLVEGGHGQSESAASRLREARTLKEIDVVAEMWVGSK